ncbi:MAG: hypothetical protein KC444_00820, partial [Nitrosopumilus sp.]|nr:hypothetical protein [Nitrosopumilus sp.]
PIDLPPGTNPLGTHGLTPISNPKKSGQTSTSLVTVRWLVESCSPIRNSPGPDGFISDHNPDIFNTKYHIIPVERSSAFPGYSPKIQEFNFIISTQLLLPDNTPLANERIEFQWANDGTEMLNDDSEILEVNDNILILRGKLKNSQFQYAKRNNFTYTDREGKAFCWIRLRLFDEKEITDMRKMFNGIKVVIGAGVPDRTDTELEMLTSRSLSYSEILLAPSKFSKDRGLLGLDTSGGLFYGIFNILVEPLKKVVETGTRIIGNIKEAVAHVPRTWQDVVGFALKRLADGIILTTPPLATIRGIEDISDEMRAVVIGVLLGIPRGLYVMLRDTIEDIKTLTFDLPRALFNFFADDPKFALEILGVISNPSTGLIIYNLDREFQEKIRTGFSKFKGLFENLSMLLQSIWNSFWQNNNQESIILSGLRNIGNWMYESFDEFVGSIATDYLGYTRNDTKYRCFVGGFIGGDFLGYIISTVGVQFLISWFTGGTGTIVSCVSRLGRVGIVLDNGLRFVRAFLIFIQKIEDLIGEAVVILGRTIKNGIGKILLSIFKLISTLLAPINDYLIEPLMKSILNISNEMQKKVVEMIYKWSFPEQINGEKIEKIALGLIEGTNSSTKNIDLVCRDCIQVLAETAEDVPGGRIGSNMLECS